jgi:high-affinity K+ transport system ATPase subunit B
MHAILGVIMIVCLLLTIVTFFLALIWIGQPIGNMAIATADVFASIFSAAFFAAFAFAMADQRSRAS